MPVPNEIPQAIKELQAQITTLTNHFQIWDNYAVNFEGSRKLREMARRLVLQSQRIDSLVKEHTFAR
jgi:hypothetical protein